MSGDECDLSDLTGNRSNGRSEASCLQQTRQLSDYSHIQLWDPIKWRTEWDEMQTDVLVVLEDDRMTVACKVDVGVDSGMFSLVGWCVCVKKDQFSLTVISFKFFWNRNNIKHVWNNLCDTHANIFPAKPNVLRIPLCPTDACTVLYKQEYQKSV